MPSHSVAGAGGGGGERVKTSHPCVATNESEARSTRISVMGQPSPLTVSTWQPERGRKGSDTSSAPWEMSARREGLLSSTSSSVAGQ